MMEDTYYQLEEALHRDFKHLKNTASRELKEHYEEVTRLQFF